MTSAGLPSVAEVVGRLLVRVPPERQPLLIALAEEMAAARYRGWAADPTNHGGGDLLLSCAEREEDIARRVAALHPGAADVQRELLASLPELVDANRDLFAGRPLDDQLAIQAGGERAGAGAWRAFAARAGAADVRDTYLACAVLEEESALALEAILGSARAERRFFDALIAASVDELEAVLASDFVLVDVMAGSLIGRADFVAAVGGGQIVFDAIEPAEPLVRLYGTTAVVTGRTRMAGRAGADAFTVRSRYTHVFALQSGAWRLVSAQGTRIAA